MATIKIKTDDGVQEYDSSALVLGENEMLIDKTNPPKGIFNQNGVNSLVKKEVNGTQEKILDKMLNSDEYSDFERKLIQRKYNVTLDEDGNPQELKPNFDKEQWKSNQSKKLTEPLNNKIKDLEGTLSSRNEQIVSKSIESAVKGSWKEDWTKQEEGIIPAVQMYRGKFGVDENGEPALMGNDGFAMNGSGEHIRPNEYFNDPERFKSKMKDTTQGGSGFQNGGGGNGHKHFTEQQVANMSDKEYEANREDILKSMNTN